MCGTSNHISGTANYICGTAHHICGTSNHICGTANHFFGTAHHNVTSVGQEVPPAAQQITSEVSLPTGDCPAAATEFAVLLVKALPLGRKLLRTEGPRMDGGSAAQHSPDRNKALNLINFF
jgi:hypothetical protein